MKTERRHELQTNVLASSLAHWTEAAQPYGKALVAGLLAIVIALFAWLFIRSQNTARTSEGWNDYFQAVNNHDDQLLQDVAEQYGGTMVSEWSQLTLADWQLDGGTNRLLVDRTLARDQLREAIEKYKAVNLQASDDTIRERATYGLARAQEAYGELDDARASYNKLATDWPESPFAATAKARAAILESQPTKQFYDWIAKYEPPKPLSGEPGTPGARPDFLKEPDVGTLNVPGSLGDKSGPSFPSGTTEPAAGTPAAPPEQPAAETPAAIPAPAAETPAATPETPAAGTPAAEPAAPESAPK
jgi:predicted negative regulator of RcsB-dependent stress response